jgi:predicted phage terminase large subunit-like protein
VTGKVISPQPGPQEDFLSTPADIAIYGGAAGGGKSYAVLLDPLRYVHLSGFGAIYFRRTAPELIGSGSLWETSHDLFSVLGAVSRQTPNLEWRFPGGGLIEFRHLQHASDVHGHQGKQYAAIYFDELTHFTSSQFWYMVSRNRSACGVRPYIRATCNPDPDSFVAKLVEWWIDEHGDAIPERSGIIRWLVREGSKDKLHWGDTREEMLARFPEQSPMSFTFIPAKLSDNPALIKADPDYLAKLQNLPRVERARLLGGNWKVKAAAGEVFRRDWFKDAAELAGVRRVRQVRAWDKAGTEPHQGNPDPDYTAGVKVSLWSDDTYTIDDIVTARLTPGKVRDFMLATARLDGMSCGVALWQDPGQAGKADVESTKASLGGFSFTSMAATKDKLTYAHLWSALAEQGRIAVPYGASWLEPFVAEAESFPDTKHDDRIDAASLAFLVLENAPRYGATVPVGTHDVRPKVRWT